MKKGIEQLLVAPDQFEQLFGRLKSRIRKPLNRIIWEGELLYNQTGVTQRRESFFAQYINQNVARIFKEHGNDLYAWRPFLHVLARSIGKLASPRFYAQHAGISPEQATIWLDALEQVGIWRRVTPLEEEAVSENGKKHKGYFTDLGLLCFILEIDHADSVFSHDLWPYLFESWVITALASQRAQLQLDEAITFSYWSDHMHVVDLVLGYRGKYYPLCIVPDEYGNEDAVIALEAFNKAYPETVFHGVQPSRVEGVIIYLGDLCCYFSMGSDEEEKPAEDQRAFGKDRLITPAQSYAKRNNIKEEEVILPGGMLLLPWFCIAE